MLDSVTSSSVQLPSGGDCDPQAANGRRTNCGAADSRTVCRGMHPFSFHSQQQMRIVSGTPAVLVISHHLSVPILL